jgi:3-mercaptopyruvate sulfurtransferase SseA
MVGPHTLYAQAHIPGAEFIGMTHEPEGIKALRERVQKLPKTRFIVLYCGCCPWDRCPNLAPAFNELKTLGFKNVKALHIPQNFGTDWVSKGLPTQKGEPAPPATQGK